MRDSGSSMLEKRSLALLAEALDRLDSELGGLAPFAPEEADGPRAREILGEVAQRMGAPDNYPYFHPLYAGQMLKPPHPIARTAYALATWLNPNNHALDGGRASSAMEKQAVRQIAAMFGWGENEHLGHLTGGGTMANLEALWVAGQTSPGAVLASSQAHYTHGRIGGVLGLAFEAVPCDARGRMDVEALSRRLARGGVGTVVATVGTTAAGAVDPLPEILELSRRHGARVHVDAAYGGYFGLAGNLEDGARRAYERLGDADSIVIDPHKHGLQPYGCGCVLFRDPSVGRLYKHDSPYTYFSSKELHLGEISLECSRAGASAVALWATMRLLPLERGGEFARRLESSRRAALRLTEKIRGDARFLASFPPELDIVIWLPREKTASRASEKSRRIFEEAARRGLHLALAELPLEFFDPEGGEVARDRDTVTCLRSVLMKPEHEAWVDAIWTIVARSCEL